MLRNTQNLNSVALILSDLNIGLVAGTGSAIAHDLRLRERLLEMPMEEFPGRPMLGKRPADPQPDTTKHTYPSGEDADFADPLRAAKSAFASPADSAESAKCSPGIQQRFPKALQQRHHHWRCSRATVASGRSGDVAVAPVCCPALVSG